MKDNFIFCFLSFFFFCSNAQDKKTYFDENWRETAKENAKFYRTQKNTAIDSIVYNKDFYINGNLQNEWFSLRNNIQQIIGSSFLYDENGNDLDENFYYPNWNENYIDKLNNIELKFYDEEGKVWRIEKINNKNYEIFTYTKDKRLFYKKIFDHYDLTKIEYTSYPNTKDLVIRFFWQNTYNLALEKFYDTENRLIKIIIYNKNGIKIDEILKENIYTYSLKESVFGEQNFKMTTKFGFVETILPAKSNISRSQIIRIDSINYINGLNKNLKLINKKDISYRWNKNYYRIATTPNKYKAHTTINGFSAENPIKNLTDDDFKLISLDKIKSQKPEELIESTKNKMYSFINKDSVMYRFVFLTSEMIVKQKLVFEKIKLRGFGSIEIRPDNEIKNWRIIENNFFSTFIVNVNGEKPILNFTNYYQSDGYFWFIPTKNGMSFNGNILTEEKSDSFFHNEFELRNTFNDFYFSNFYTKLEEDGKEVFYSTFGNKLFSGYKIEFNTNFILVKNDEKVEIYNYLLQNITPQNTQAAYLFNDHVTVIKDNNVIQINSVGEKYFKPQIQSMECGTGRCYNHSGLGINDKLNKLQLNSSSQCDAMTFYENITFLNIESSWKTEMINRNNIQENDIIKYFDDKKENYFIVENGTKFGLFNYEKQDLRPEPKLVVEESKPTYTIFTRTVYNKKTGKRKKISEKILNAQIPRMISESDLRTSKYVCEAKNILPINCDEIIFKEDFFIFKNDNLYGIYPVNKKEQYLKIGKRIDHFIEITNLENQNGWLDIQTGKEYY